MNYEPLIERDLDAIPAAAHAFLETHGAEELWTAVTRFAVLAFAPSQHSKRAVMACRAALDVREDLGDRWPEMIIACARYAAQSRQPWSEPPILDPPQPSSGELEELRAAIAAADRLRAERWLSARLNDAEVALREIAAGDSLLMLDTAVALLSRLGEKGRFALLRMPVWELIANGIERDETVPMQTLIARAVEEDGAPDAVRAVLIAHVRQLRSAGFPPAGEPASSRRELVPYDLARDYAQTLIAHGYHLDDVVLHAVHYNLEHGESFAEWSFA